MRRERTDDCKIEFTCRNFLDQIVQCIIIQKSELAALPGIFADKAGERPGGAAGTQGADAELPFKVAVRQMGKFLDLFVFPADNAEPFNQCLSCFCRNHAAGNPVKKTNTEILFQLPDRIA